MKKFNIVATLAVVFALALAMAIGSFTTEKAHAEAENLTFSSDNWEVKSGNVTLDGSSSITFDVSQSGENFAWIQTKKTYTDFHIQYKETWRWPEGHNNQIWTGLAGMILNQKADSDKLDGLYAAHYEWGQELVSSFGYYYDGNFQMLNNGMDDYFGETGYNTHTFDFYVQDGTALMLIDGWLIHAIPVLRNESGKVAIISNQNGPTFEDVIIEQLPEGFDIANKVERANWSGFNVLAGMYYDYNAGSDTSFDVRLPDDITGVKAYYLARRHKYTDKGQTVDVYVDVTGKSDFDDATKAATWGDSTVSYIDGTFYAMNMTKLDLSAFEGAKAGEKVSILLDKNIDGWYSASSYFLLYEDESGTLRIADFIDLAYDFSKNEHNYVNANGSTNEFTFHFFRKEFDVIVTHERGAEAKIVGQPSATKISDIEYEFASGETSKTFDINDYVDIDLKHKSAVVSYKVNGEAVSDLTFDAGAASGVITVTIAPDGSSNDLSGAIYFDTITLDVNYTFSMGKVKVTYHVGETTDEREYDYGDEVSLTAPETELAFDGWYLDEEFTTPVTELTATEDVELYAKLTALEPSQSDEASDGGETQSATDSGKKKRGCGGVVSGFGILGLALALGAAFAVRRKKED